MRTFKVTAEFELKVVRKTRLDNLKISLDLPKDTEENVIRKTLHDSISNKWGGGEIVPENGVLTDEEYDDCDSSIESIEFEEIIDPPFVDPDQITIEI